MLIALDVSMTPMTMNQLEVCDVPTSKARSAPFPGIHFHSESIQRSQEAGSESGLHKLWYPGIRDMSTWTKFGAHGEHGDVLLFSNLGAL